LGDEGNALFDNGVILVPIAPSGVAYIQTSNVSEKVESNTMAFPAGSYHSLFLKSEDSLWAMRYNYNGQPGTRTTTDGGKPVNIIDGTAN